MRSLGAYFNKYRTVVRHVLELDLQSSADLIRLQSVQNRAAGLVTQAKTQDHIRPTPVVRNLQWLPVSSRIPIDFICACICIRH